MVNKMNDLNILVLSKNMENYRSGYYHQDLIDAIHKFGNVFLYGIKYPNYDINDTIGDVINKSGWNIDDIDLIIVSTSWENEDPRILESDPHPKINLSKLNIPKIFFLNKEYKKLDKKLEYIKKNQFDLVLTVLPEEKFKEWEKLTGIKFMQSHFGININRFRPFGLKRMYDFSFTGSLHTQYTNLRLLVKKEIFKESKIHIKSNKGLWRLISISNPINENYQKYRIYWAEWHPLSRDFWGRSLLPNGKKYVELLNRSKVFFNTLSAEGIFNTRFFELMATKSLIFCPEDSYYGILKDGYNCIMFKKDLSNFEDKLENAIFNEDIRNKIVENAFKDSKNHTYEGRLKTIFNYLGVIK